MENFAFFENAFQRQSEEEQSAVYESLKTVFQFIGKRSRDWSLIYFKTTSSNFDSCNFVQNECLGHLTPYQRKYYQTPIVLYYKPGILRRLFVGYNGDYKYYPDLYTYIAQEKQSDILFKQQMMQCLPRDFLQMSFAERAAAAEASQTDSAVPQGEEEEQKNDEA